MRDDTLSLNGAIADADLRAALDATVRDSLKPATLGLGALYLVFAASHALLLPAAIAPLMSAMAASTAVLLLGLRWVLGRWPLSPRWAHPAGAGIASLALLNSLLHLYLTAEPQQTTNLLLLILGAGFLLLSTRWLALVIVVTLTGWSVVALLSPPIPTWPHFGFALLTATVLAVITHTVRVRTLRRLEKTRALEKHQRTDLERALKAVQWSERRLGTILESATEGILLIEEGGRIAFANTSVEQMFGYDREEMLSCPLDQLIPDTVRDRHAEHCAGYFRSPRPRPMGLSPNLAGRRKDGSEFPVDISLSFVQTADETLVIAFVIDITERKQAEKALQEYSERLEDMVAERTQELREAHEQLLTQQQLQRDIELAAQVQANLLPRQVPTLDGFEFAAAALPARYVSGDLYDFVLTDPSTCHIILADIAGKGVSAALLTSTARALLRAEMDHDDAPSAILSSVNTSLYEELAHAEMFITCLDARLDARPGTLTYANAGHTQILWWQQAGQACRALPATGIPIGIFADAAITEETLALRPGDVLAFYSDGITEAANARDELFGTDRLRDLLAAHAHRPAADLCETIAETVEAFRAGAPRSDDLTLVILQALPRTITFRCPARLENLHDVTSSVRQAAAAYGDDFAYQLELATSEIVTNVIRHAYALSPGEVRAQITLLPDQVRLDLYDDGAPLDLASVPAPDLGKLHEGGYGLFIARQMVDELHYTSASGSNPEGNHWKLIKSSVKDFQEKA